MTKASKICVLRGRLRAPTGRLTGESSRLSSDRVQGRLQAIRDDLGILNETITCSYPPCHLLSAPGTAYCSPRHQTLNHLSPTRVTSP